jgi:hypothetical protein
MPKTFWAVAVTAWFCLLVTLSACSKTALDRAADLEAQKWWDKTVVKCGQTYYARNRWINMAAVRPNMSREQLEKDVEKKELFEFMDAGYVVRAEPVTKADKLNGREWQGRVEIVATAFRKYDDSSKRWESWRDGVPKFPNPLTQVENPFGIYLIFANGKWGDHDNPYDLPKPECAQIPQ